MSGIDPMTHPLTPREKVEREVLDAVFSGFEHGQCEKEWEPEYGKEIASLATDAILTALASGSGDHAELARVTSYVAHAREIRQGAILVSTGDLEALLAENAALRGDGEIYQNQADHEFRLRKESERKLAEAYRTARQFLAATSGTTYPSNHPMWAAIESAQQLLSKEAERG